jgi:hypothetical protein
MQDRIPAEEIPSVSCSKACAAGSSGAAKGSHLCIRSADLMASPKHRRHVSWE